MEGEEGGRGKGEKNGRKRKEREGKNGQSWNIGSTWKTVL